VTVRLILKHISLVLQQFVLGLVHC